MTQAADILAPTRASEDKLIAGVCVAHFVSHYYMLLLAPLFVFIKDDYGVTYTELSLALAAFGVVSSVLQTPVGFFVDRFGARLNLIGGLLLGSAAVAVAGLVDSFWVFIAMFAVMGLANTVYHPADYALLSERVSPPRSASVLLPYLLGHDRLCRCAGHPSVHAEPGGMARRFCLCRGTRRHCGAHPRAAG
jgi:FSR family fosmidomycin resistance protein-like MFS transporter